MTPGCFLHFMQNFCISCQIRENMRKSAILFLTGNREKGFLKAPNKRRKGKNHGKIFNTGTGPGFYRPGSQ